MRLIRAACHTDNATEAGKLFMMQQRGPPRLVGVHYLLDCRDAVRGTPGLRPSMVKRERFRTAVHWLFDAAMCLTVLYVQRRHCGPCTCSHASG